MSRKKGSSILCSRYTKGAAYTEFNMCSGSQGIREQIRSLMIRFIKEHPESVDFGCSLEETFTNRMTLILSGSSNIRTRVCIHNDKIRAMCIVWIDSRFKKVYIDNAIELETTDEDSYNLTILIASTLSSLCNELDDFEVIIRAPEYVLGDLKRVWNICIDTCTVKTGRDIIRKRVDLYELQSLNTLRFKKDINSDEEIAKQIAARLSLRRKNRASKRRVLDKE